MEKGIEKLIDLYFDDELEKGKEPMLFLTLSQDEEARNYFKQMNSIKTNMNYTTEEFPASLDEKILRAVEKSASANKKLFIDKKKLDVFVYASAIILMLVSIFLYSESEEYKVQFFDLTREVKKQNEQLKLIMNALPEIQVYSDESNAKQVNYKPSI